MGFLNSAVARFGAKVYHYDTKPLPTQPVHQQALPYMQRQYSCTEVRIGIEYAHIRG